MKLYRIKKSNIDRNGRGLYATKNIKEGTRIIDYVGKIITKKKTDQSEKFDNSKPIYLFNLTNRYDLDGDVSWNTARLINHSCSNNCEYEGKGLKLWVTSIKDIKKGLWIDATFGLGGYSRSFLENTNCNVFAIDRDPDVKKYANTLIKEFKNRFEFKSAKFSDLNKFTHLKNVVGISR